MPFNTKMDEQLFDASINHYLEQVIALLNQGFSITWTPLHYAAYNENLEIVKLLFDHRAVHHEPADVNAVNKFNETPLHYAAFKGNLEIVKFLLDRGADRSIENGCCNTAADLAKTTELGEFIETYQTNSRVVN